MGIAIATLAVAFAVIVVPVLLPVLGAIFLGSIIYEYFKRNKNE